MATALTINTYSDVSRDMHPHIESSFVASQANRRGSVFGDMCAQILMQMKYSHSTSGDLTPLMEATHISTPLCSTSSPVPFSPSVFEPHTELECANTLQSDISSAPSSPSSADSAASKTFRRTLYGNEWGTKNTASTLGHCLNDQCTLCERGSPSLLVKSPTWASIMRVVFFCLQYDYPSKQFFSLKNDVYQFMVEHWNKLCLNKKRSDNWHKQIQDMLSHSKNVFESGVDIFKQNGYWRLRQLTDPWTMDRETAIISKKASAGSVPSPSLPLPCLSPKRSIDDCDAPDACQTKPDLAVLSSSPKKFKITPPASPSVVDKLAPFASSISLSSPRSSTPEAELDETNASDVAALRQRLSGLTSSLVSLKCDMNANLRKALDMHSGPAVRAHTISFEFPVSAGVPQM